MTSLSDEKLPLAEEKTTGEICRVCRSEGTAEQPLFYPCLCSGSIKYIHQECLIEWLKHSKKKYCELCKHPFTFTPVYADQMPSKLPIAILAWTLFKKFIRSAKVAFTFCLACILWFVVLPLISSFILRYYFGWSLTGYLNPMREMKKTLTSGDEELIDFILDGMVDLIFNVLQGLLILGFTILLIIAMMLVKEFLGTVDFEPGNNPIRTSNNLQQQSSSIESVSDETDLSEGYQEDNDAVPFPASMESALFGDSSSFVTTATEDSFASTAINELALNRRNSVLWLDHVHPKEYRNFLRRKELHRERMNQEQIRIQDRRHLIRSSDDSNNDNDNDNSLALSANISNNSSIRTRFSGLSQVATNVSTSRDNMNSRCRICFSTTCISREHAVKASKQRYESEARRNQAIMESQSNELSSSTIVGTQTLNESSSATLQDQINRTQDRTQPRPRQSNQSGLFENDDIFFGLNLDQAEEMTLNEFFGFSSNTSIFTLIQNATIVTACNVLIMHIFLFFPYFIGHGIFSISQNFNFSTLIKTAFSKLVIKSGLVGFIPDAIRDYASSQMSFVWECLKFFKLKVGSFPEFLCFVMFGYFSLTLSINAVTPFILKRPFKPNHSFFSRFIRPSILFLGIFLKITLILAAEVIISPIICGWFVDISTLSLLQASLASRIVSITRYPFTNCFIHWAIGAAFMVLFTTFIGFNRTFLRPGLLYFLRNPSDPDNHPIKDIATRSFHFQIYTFCFSMMIVGFLVFSSVGIAVLYMIPMIEYVTKLRIAPLNIKFDDPLAEVPVDLILNFVIKSIVSSLKPTKLFGLIFKTLFLQLLGALRLSSYFIGRGRYLDEEFFPREGQWEAVPDFDRLYTRENLKSIRSIAISPLDISFLPIIRDKDGNRVAQLPPQSENQSQRQGWTPAFKPSWFYLRVLIVIIFVILSIQVFFSFTFVLPIILGRFIFSSVVKKFDLPSKIILPIHEIYSLSIGVLLVVIGLKGIEILTKFVMVQLGVINDGGTVSNLSLVEVAKIALIWTKFLLKAIIASTFILIIWPFLGGVLFSSILSPLLYSSTGSQSFRDFPLILTALFNPSQTQRIIQDSLKDPFTVGGLDLISPRATVIVFFFASWSLGLPILRLAWGVRHWLTFSPHTIQTLENLFNSIVHNSLLHQVYSFSLCNLLTSCLIPITLQLLFLTLLPPLLPLLLFPLLLPKSSSSTLPLILATQKFSHLAFLLSFALYRFVDWLRQMYRSIICSIRDENYLVGRRLHNLENRIQS